LNAGKNPFYFYDEKDGELVLNNMMGTEYYAEYCSTMVAAPDAYKEAIKSTLPLTTKVVDSYLTTKYDI